MSQNPAEIHSVYGQIYGSHFNFELILCNRESHLDCSKMNHKKIRLNERKSNIQLANPQLCFLVFKQTSAPNNSCSRLTPTLSVSLCIPYGAPLLLEMLTLRKKLLKHAYGQYQIMNLLQYLLQGKFNFATIKVTNLVITPQSEDCG